MALLRFVRNHPLALLAVVVAGFGAWLACDAARPAERPPLDAVTARTVPVLPLQLDAVAPAGRRPGVVTAEVVSHLQPGMARVDVEGLIGPPPADLVAPVTTADGRTTYRTTYLANLSARRPGAAAPDPRSLIALEYDASRPGHPLVKVHLPPPTS